MQTITCPLEEYMANHSALVAASNIKVAECDKRIKDMEDTLQSLDAAGFDFSHMSATAALDALEDNYTDWSRCYCQIQSLLSRANNAPLA